MRTTLNLDDDVLRAVKEVAALTRRTLGRVVSDLVRASLLADRSGAELRNGVPLLPPREGAGLVTMEDVNQLLEEP